MYGIGTLLEQSNHSFGSDFEVVVLFKQQQRRRCSNNQHHHHHHHQVKWKFLNENNKKKKKYSVWLICHFFFDSYPPNNFDVFFCLFVWCFQKFQSKFNSIDRIVWKISSEFPVNAICCVFFVAKVEFSFLFCVR